jgi:hypothetical protein
MKIDESSEPSGIKELERPSRIQRIISSILHYPSLKARSFLATPRYSSRFSSLEWCITFVITLEAFRKLKFGKE